jgi:hypothetical protein
MVPIPALDLEISNVEAGRITTSRVPYLSPLIDFQLGEKGIQCIAGNSSVGRR